jgi:hypothetical protein
VGANLPQGGCRVVRKTSLKELDLTDAAGRDDRPLSVSRAGATLVRSSPVTRGAQQGCQLLRHRRSLQSLARRDLPCANQIGE